MIRTDEVLERIEAQVPSLEGKLRHAADWALLVERNQLPQVTPAGFVLFGGMRGGGADAATGLFRQAFDEVVSVVLVLRGAGDPLAARSLDEAMPIVRAVIEAVAGWAPDEAIGVFVLMQSELVGAKDGALVIQTDFALNDQLRIPRP